MQPKKSCKNNMICVFFVRFLGPKYGHEYKFHTDDELNQKISDSVARDFKSFSIFNSPASEIENAKGAYEALKDITFDKKIPEVSESFG